MTSWLFWYSTDASADRPQSNCFLGSIPESSGDKTRLLIGMRPHNQPQWAIWLISASWKQGATLGEGTHCCSTVLPVGLLLSGSNSGRLATKGQQWQEATGRPVKCGYAPWDLFGKGECSTTFVSKPNNCLASATLEHDRHATWKPRWGALSLRGFCRPD